MKVALTSVTDSHHLRVDIFALISLGGSAQISKGQFRGQMLGTLPAHSPQQGSRHLVFFLVVPATQSVALKRTVVDT